METTSSLRRQAAFCLRLSELCADTVLANHLQSKAAQYHEEALRSEFELGHDTVSDEARCAGSIVRH